MKRKTLFWLLASLVIGIGLALVFRDGEAFQPVKGPSVVPGSFTLSGPHEHENLTIFLVHGRDQLSDRNFITLEEGLEQGLVVVHETENVSALTVENLSSTEDLFIQAGDIVKGGKQDRTLEYDLIVPPDSGKVPLASLCVESGRWKKRGQENLYSFGYSSRSLPTKELKLAAMYHKNQGEVWANVARTQENLSNNVGQSVRSADSQSSLQLSLETQAVKDAVEPCLNSLLSIIDDREDVIGYVVVVNGKISYAEVYASGALFRKLWSKLLRAGAVEAVANLHEQRAAPVTGAGVREFLAGAERGNTVQDAGNDRVKLIMQENSESVLFETRARTKPDFWVHRTYLTK